MNIEYVAGFFDGEGTVTTLRSKKGYVGASVGLCNTDEEIIRTIQREFGGTLAVCRPGTGSKRPTWRLWWGGDRAQSLLLQMLPHLRVKHKQAELALILLANRVDRSQRRSITPQMRSMNAWLGQTIRDLNHGRKR